MLHFIYMKLVIKLFLVFLIVGTLTITKVQIVSAQRCITTPCASCAQSGLQCVFNNCPAGFQLVNPSDAANCINLNECGSGTTMLYDCEEITSPTTEPCPSQNPICTSLTGALCNAAGGIPWSQGCPITASEVGNCCIAADFDDTCGGNLQTCCGDVGYHTCDVVDGVQLVCASFAGAPTCCDPSDPTCQSMPASTCTGTCKAGCDANEHVSPGSCPVAEPVCCTINAGGASAALCSDGVSVSTAIGCIPVNDPFELTRFILTWAIGIGGGIAFLFIVYSGVLILSSAGNPQKVAAGKELLTSAVAGLLMLIFAVFILRIIGVNILGIFI